MQRIAVAIVLLVVSLQANAGMQEKRLEFIQKLVDNRVIQKVEQPATYPHVWVRANFYALDFDTKSQFINVIWAYFKTRDPKADIVVLYDSRTGKEVGRYAEVYGGLELD